MIKIKKRIWSIETWRTPKYIRPNGKTIIFTDYLISNYSRIKNKNGYILNPYKDKKGYYRIDLVNSNKRYSLKYHRLLVSTFISIGDNSIETVNHKDGNKSNYTLDNLEWNSCSQNSQHAYDTGLHGDVIGDKHGKTWIGETNVDKICQLLQNTDLKYAEIAETFSDICERNNRTIKQLVNIIKDIKKKKSYAYIGNLYDFSNRDKILGNNKIVQRLSSEGE